MTPRLGPLESLGGGEAVPPAYGELGFCPFLLYELSASEAQVKSKSSRCQVEVKSKSSPALPPCASLRAHLPLG